MTVDRSAAAAPPPTLADRYAGCLLGLACGDALGGPVEFRSRAEIARDFPAGVRDFVGGGWLALAPGETTDDTQLALALGRALTPAGLDHSLLTVEFVAWYRSSPKDIGRTTRAALERLAAGVPWHRAGELALAAGGVSAATNGALMRCAPVALRFRRDPLALTQASIDSARITHADPRCRWSAVALNRALAHLLEGGSAAALPAVAAAVPEPAVSAAVLAASGLAAGDVRADGFVLHTLGAALWSFLRHATFEETVVAAVGLGDDADTTGAVAGALAGAHYGAAAIPPRWLALLHGREALISLADRLLGLSERAGRGSSGSSMDREGPPPGVADGGSSADR